MTLIAALALGISVWPQAPVAATGTGPVEPSVRILVMPFENVTRNSRIFWLGEASSVILADDLNALGTDAITREERRHAFERLQVPPAAALTQATIIRIAQIVGAARVVLGTVQMDHESLVVRARVVGLESARVVNDITERGSLGGINGRVPANPAADIRLPASPCSTRYRTTPLARAVDSSHALG